MINSKNKILLLHKMQSRLIRFYIPSLLLALSFLTVLPTSVKMYRDSIFAVLLKLSLNFYPLVGLVIGFVLCASIYISAVLPATLQAIVVLIAWVLITGALHLDGFADTIDAAYAGHKYTGKKRQKKIHAVFKDSHIGAMAVVGLVLLLLVKYLLIAHYLTIQHSYSVIFFIAAAFIARLGALMYIQSTPYVSKKGTLSIIYKQNYQPEHIKSLLIYIAGALLLAFLLDISGWLISVFMCMSLLILCWRNYWYRKIGGFNGDCVGALIEIIECLVLLLAFALVP